MILQRVRDARVLVDAVEVGSIGRGILALVGFVESDTEHQLAPLLHKCLDLRIFPDVEGKMNCSLRDIGGAMLLVSQFTLYADCSKGRRPSFEKALAPHEASRLFDLLVAMAKSEGLPVATGVFGASMQVELCNDGPATFLLESKS